MGDKNQKTIELLSKVVNSLPLGSFTKACEDAELTELEKSYLLDELFEGDENSYV